MKKILGTLFMALTAVTMMAQEPVITFEKTVHDFGKINEADGRVSAIFEFKNEGMSPLVLSNVRASCGCTTPKWTREPIEPGQTGQVTVTYNPNGRPGRFQKTVTVTSNAKTPTVRVYVKGEVIPKQAKPQNQYKIAVGELNMKSKVLDFGTVKKGEVKESNLEYTNQTQVEHQVELLTNSAADAYLVHDISLRTIKPKEVGQFKFLLDTKASKLYGPVEAYAYVQVDGKRNISEPFKLTIKANIVEDFSSLTVADKQQAPIAEIPAAYNAGNIAAGKTHKASIKLKNIGINPLEIRRVLCTGNNISLKSPKAIKSGKKGNLGVEISAKGLKPGSYSREITVITNDYKNPVKKIQVNFIVE